MIVVDASAVVVLLAGEPAAAGAVAARVEVAGPCAVPHLLDVEVANAFRGLVRRGDLAARQVGGLLDDLEGLELVRYPHVPFLPRVWALRDRLSAYDAVYVGLAEALDCPLVTADARLARAAERLVDVEVVR